MISRGKDGRRLLRIETIIYKRKAILIFLIFREGVARLCKLVIFRNMKTMIRDKSCHGRYFARIFISEVSQSEMDQRYIYELIGRVLQR